MTKQLEIVKHFPPVLSRFMRSNARRRGVRGPIGSGKSVGCSWELFDRAQAQRPSSEGIRRSRIAVVRNTYRELLDTTVKTWLEQFPERLWGAFNRQTMTHHIKLPKTPKEPGLDMEVMFRALDRPDDIKKLLSLELTMAWVNEAREIPFSIIQTLDDRVGRFPPASEEGCTYRGVIMDTNPPDEDSWWFRLAHNLDIRTGEPKEGVLEGWTFYDQPPGVIRAGTEWRTNPDAENLENLEANFYAERCQGRTDDHIKVFYANEYGFAVDGRPIYPEYQDSIHCQPCEPNRHKPIHIGLDFGLTPVAVFSQQLPGGRWIVFDELQSHDMGILRFCEWFGPMLRSKYGDFEKVITGDPAGSQRAQTDEHTVFEMLNGQGIPATPASTNDFDIRREAVATALSRMIDGKPGLVISPECRYLRKGMAGGYCYRRLNVPGRERFMDKPDKNEYSHAPEALQYALMGAGEARTVIPRPRHWDKPIEYPANHVSRGVV